MKLIILPHREHFSLFVVLTQCRSQECMIGVVFADEGEAKTFFKKVTTTKLGTGK